MRKKRRRCSGGVVALLLVLALGLQGADKKRAKAGPQAVLFGSVFQENGFLVRGARVVMWNAERRSEERRVGKECRL